MYTDLMIDLETWGIAPGCAIRSIGAVFFDMDNEAIIDRLGPEFYCNVDDSDGEQGRPHFHRNPSTVEWWATQSEEAQRVLLVDQRPLVDALMDLSAWIKLHSPDQQVRVWSHGLSFDIPILDYAYRLIDLPSMWKYDRLRDTRTLGMILEHYNHGSLNEMNHMLTDLLKNHGVEFVKHHALHDAKYQALMVQLIAYRMAG